MRPDRIIVGEVRQEECLDLLIALNSGLPGMCSIHANSAREAIVKLCTLPLLAGENVGHALRRPDRRGLVDLVVHTAKDASGQRRVREIVAVPGRVEGDVVEVADLFVTRGGRLVRAQGFPPHPERFAQARRRPVPAAARRPDGRAAGAAVRAGLPAGVAVGQPRAGAGSGPRRPGWHERTTDLLAQAGIEGVTPGRLVAASAALGLVVSVLRARHQPGAGDRARVRGCSPRRAAGAGAPAPRAAPGRAARGLARGRRQPRQRACAPGCRCPRRSASSAQRGPEPLRAPFTPLRPGLPGHRPLRRLPRPAQGRARRPRRRPGRRGAAAGPRGRRHRPRPAAAHAVDLPARGRPHPRRARRRGRAGRSTRPGSRCARRGRCCCCCRCSPRPSRPTTPPPAPSCCCSAAAPRWSPTG